MFFFWNFHFFTKNRKHFICFILVLIQTIARRVHESYVRNTFSNVHKVMEGKKKKIEESRGIKTHVKIKRSRCRCYINKIINIFIKFKVAIPINLIFIAILFAFLLLFISLSSHSTAGVLYLWICTRKRMSNSIWSHCPWWKIFLFLLSFIFRLIFFFLDFSNSNAKCFCLWFWENWNHRWSTYLESNSRIEWKLAFGIFYKQLQCVRFV